MKKRMAIILTAVALCLLSVLCVGLSRVDATDETVLQPTYPVGATVEIPAGQVTVGGTRYDAETVVYTPDGYAYKTDSIVADRMGVYTVEYRAAVDGRFVSEKTTFETYGEQFTVSGAGEAAYGKESKYGTNLDGILVSLHAGETFTYREPVDLKNLDKKKPFFKMFATPSTEVGTRDVASLCLRLTDAYDADNYVTVRVNSVGNAGSDTWWVNNVYVLAGRKGTAMKGIEWGKNTVHADNQWGFPVAYSLYGYRNFQNSVGKEFFSLCYDITDNKLYGPVFEDGYIIDLDDARYFSDAWQGFTTTEVYLSFWGESYYRDTFDFVIGEIGGCDLTPHPVFDRAAPLLRIDETDLPTAGIDTPYPVPTATAYDRSAGALPVTTKVFCNYRAENRYEVPIADGAFTPTEKGAYTVEYTATDYAGNTATQTVSVLCDGENRALALTLCDRITDGKTGEPIAVAMPATAGGVGDVTVQTRVTFDGKDVAIQNGRFVPQSAGLYEVTVTASDFAGQTATESYRVDVAVNDKPVIADVALPDALVIGGVYRIPNATAYDYRMQQTADCAVTVDGAALSGGVYTVPDGAGDTVEIVYRSGTAQKTYRVPVVTGETYAALFITDGTATAAANGVTLSDGAFTFANALRSDLSITVAVGDGSDLTLTLTDYVRADEQTAFPLTDGRYTVTYDRVKNTLSIDGRTIATAAFGSGVRLTGVVRGSATFSAINGRELFGAVASAPQLAVDGDYALSMPHGGTLTVLPATAFDVVRPNTDCRVTVTDPFRETVLDNAAADVAHEVPLRQLGAYTVAYTAAGTTVKYTIRVVDSSPPTITVNGAVPTAARVGADLEIPTATAFDAVEGRTAVGYFLIRPSGMFVPIQDLLTEANETTVTVRPDTVGTWKLRYFATDSQGNYAYVDYAVAVTE